MDLQYHNDVPSIPYFTIDNCFGKDINKKILEEADKNKNKFNLGQTGGGIDQLMRTNTTAYYDELYKDKRDSSVLLSSIQKLFGNNRVSEPLISSPYPFNMFKVTNYHETQVSRYGDDGQQYKFHADSGLDTSLNRLITFVYYFNVEPKRWAGGNLELIDSPLFYGNPIQKKFNKVIIEPRNDLGVFFPSYLGHRVTRTTSPKDFISGRFSVNCWIGMK